MTTASSAPEIRAPAQGAAGDEREVLRLAAEAVSSPGDGDIFATLTGAATRILGIDIAFIGVLGEDKRHIATIAVSEHGRRAEDFGYPLTGTPCENVVGQTFRYYPQGIQQQFPDPHLKEVDGVGYAAIPLFDNLGNAIGLMALVSRAPLKDRALIEAVLRIFSVRAANELERRHADAARLHSEQSYRSLFDAAEDALFVHDPNSGRILDINPKACEIYGYTREELLAADIDRLSSGEPPYTGAQAAKFIEQALRDGPVHVEWQRRNKDGSLHWDEVYIKSVKLEGKDRILAVTREITDRKAREDALRKSEDRLRATVDTALDCIVCIDEQGRIIELNPAAERTFGCRKADMLGRSLAELMIPEHQRDAHENGMKRYLATGEKRYLGRRVELSAMRADGSEFPVEIAIGVAQGPEGRIFIGYLRDITARRDAEAERLRLEQQLRQAQKMEAIGQLTGGIAHDFNNILTATMGYLEMARELAEPLGSDKLGRYLERAEGSARRAKELIAQMLTFSRGRRGAPRSLQLAPHLTEAVRLLQSTLPSSVEITTVVDGDVPCVLVDPLHLEQVLMNLCINARDAMRGKGRLAIALRRRHCDGCVCASCHQTVDGDYVELECADTGPGIGAEVMERMFEPFYSTKEVGEGSGMGLAMVHGIVHEYGGHVHAESRPGQGATLRIWLPAWFPPNPEPERVGEDASKPPATGEGGMTGRVLVAEDEPSVREFIEDLLRSWGLDVIMTENGVSACAAFATAPDDFALVLLDQTMPRMTGLEAAREIGKLRPAQPVILYTGHSEHVTDEQLSAAGVRALVRKPLDIQGFRRLLQTLLEVGSGT